MDSKAALTFIVDRHKRSLEKLEKEYQSKLIETGAFACLSGPLFENDPASIESYIELRAWKTVRREQMSQLFAAEVQVWFDCSM